MRRSAVPAVLFFHGGGWSSGSPTQFDRQARALSEKDGIVGITADYRIAKLDRSSPNDAVDDAIAAMCWVREHSAQLGIDPARIAAAGGSAGGHLALATYMFADKGRKSCPTGVGARPNALILFNPVLDLEGRWEKRFSTSLDGVSPLRKLDSALPPTLILQGTDDTVASLATAQQFVGVARQLGTQVLSLVTYKGRTHGFFNQEKSGDLEASLEDARQFLREIDWLDGDR